MKTKENERKTQWRTVEEHPKDGEIVLTKLDNGLYQCSKWVDDGKGFDDNFLEINFADGTSIKLPVTVKVVAWRPLDDVISELEQCGVINDRK